MTTPAPREFRYKGGGHLPGNQLHKYMSLTIFAEPQQYTPLTSATSVLESKPPAPSELLETIEPKKRTEDGTRSLDQNVTANADLASCQGGLTTAEPPLEC